MGAHRRHAVGPEQPHRLLEAEPAAAGTQRLRDEHGRCVGVDTPRWYDVRRAAAPVPGVACGMRERAGGVLRRGVDRDLVVLDTTGGTRRLRGHQDRQHRDVGPASGGTDRAQHHVRASPRQRLEEDRDDRVHARVGRHRLDRPAEVRARGGGEHVDRVRQCRRGRQVIGERPASVLRERLDPQAGRHAGIDAGDRRSAGVGDDRHAVAPRQRLVREQLGDVELLVQGLDADDARVVEERVDVPRPRPAAEHRYATTRRAAPRRCARS